MITPHSAWLTPHSWEDTRRKSAETMRAALLTNGPQNVILRRCFSLFMGRQRGAPMHLLHLLRHAKSARADEGSDDRLRPLSRVGAGGRPVRRAQPADGARLCRPRAVFDRAADPRNRCAGPGGLRRVAPGRLRGRALSGCAAGPDPAVASAGRGHAGRAADRPQPRAARARGGARCPGIVALSGRWPRASSRQRRGRASSSKQAWADLDRARHALRDYVTPKSLRESG